MTIENSSPDMMADFSECTQTDLEEEKQRPVDANFSREVVASIKGAPSSQTSNSTTALTTRERKAQTYMAALEVSRVELARLILNQENGCWKPLRSLDPQIAKNLLCDICVPILAAANEAVLREIIGGNLALAYRKNPEVRKDLIKKIERGNVQPGIYMQLFVGPNGQSPSPADLAQLCQPVRSYCEFPKTKQQTIEAELIDQAFDCESRWGLSMAQRGKLKYLCDMSSSDPQISQNHIINIIHFVENLEQRLEPLRDTPAWTRPLDAPLVEVGYARAPKKRLSQHRHQQMSNYIMNLWEAASKVIFGEGEFYMRQFIIFHIFEASQASFAEILFTRLAQGYIDDGGGFSHTLAGRSNNSVIVSSQLQWDSFRQYTWDHTSFKVVMKSEIIKAGQIADGDLQQPSEIDNLTDLLENLGLRNDLSGLSRVLKRKV